MFLVKLAIPVICKSPFTVKVVPEAIVIVTLELSPEHWLVKASQTASLFMFKVIAVVLLPS